GRDLGDDLVQRVVPRGDGADHADGFAQDEGVADPLGPGEVRGGGDGVAEHRQRQSHLDAVGDRLGGAHLRGDEGGHLRGPYGELAAQGVQVRDAFGDVGGGPGVEGLVGGAYGEVDVVGAAQRDAGDGLPGVGVLHRDAVAGLGCGPLAADVDSVGGDHGASRRCRSDEGADAGERAADDEFLDLAGALVQGGDTGVPQVLAGRVLVDVAVAAEDLHGVVGGAHGRLGG